METVTIASCLRHVLRNQGAWGKRIMIVSVNLAAIRVVMKGRSSKRRTFTLARQIGAMCLAMGVKIYLRWTPSARKWADGPSRGHGIGYWDASARKVITRLKQD